MLYAISRCEGYYGKQQPDEIWRPEPASVANRFEADSLEEAIEETKRIVERAASDVLSGDIQFWAVFREVGDLEVQLHVNWVVEGF